MGSKNPRFTEDTMTWAIEFVKLSKIDENSKDDNELRCEAEGILGLMVQEFEDKLKRGIIEGASNMSSREYNKYFQERLPYDIFRHQEVLEKKKSHLFEEYPDPVDTCTFVRSPDGQEKIVQTRSG